MKRGFEEKRWRRYGHDRTYVSLVPGGTPLGYRNNKSGELFPTSPEQCDLLAAWARDATQPASQGSEPTRKPANEQVVLEPDVPESVDDLLTVGWDDLAAHRAGQGARAKAGEELAARRERVGRFRTWAGRVLDVHTDERAWRVGAAAEESVGRELESLREHGWRVLHSVTVGAGESDIDHVLIGPGGVVTVNSKHHPGKNVWVVKNQIRVNGQYVPYLRNSRHEAARAAQVLSQCVGFPVQTTPCLVFRLGNGKITMKEEPADVLVLRATKAAKALRSRTGVLNLGEIEQVYEAARRSTSWTDKSQ